MFGRAVNILAFLFAAAPFAFGQIRLAQTGTDARYVVVALASSAGAAIARAQTRPVTR